MVEYQKGSMTEYAKGYVIKYGLGHKTRSQIFSSRKDAVKVMNDYMQVYLSKGSKPKVVKDIYEKPKPFTEEEKKNLAEVSKFMNKTIRVVLK